MTTVARRGWLIAALVFAVAVLIGTILVAATWSGNLGRGAAGATGNFPGSVMMQSSRADDDRMSMMGRGGRAGTSEARRANCAEVMSGRDR